MFSEDLLNLIIDPRKCKSSCFLCFKHEEKATSIYENVEILDGYSNTSLSLIDIMNDLFPGHETLLDQACNRCKNLVIKMYVVLRKNKFKRILLSKIIDTINGEVSKKHMKARITLELPNLKDLIIDKNKNIAKSENDNNQDMIEKTDLSSVKCSLTFKSTELLRKQKLVCRINSKATICDTCGKRCKDSNGLRVHLNCHRVKQCPVCFKTLKSNSHFTLHVKQHENTVKRQRKKVYYNCHDCDYKSVNKTTLEAHINKNHLLIRPYKCLVCPKTFCKKSNLTQHKMIHENVKKEMCHVCGEHFVSPKTLSIHMKLHTDDKSFECKICHQKFVTSGYRLEHFMRKHTEKSHKCPKCGKMYGLKKDLTRHFKEVHLPDDAGEM